MSSFFNEEGPFSTYAYRLIWNEICDALNYANKRQSRECACDELPIIVANDGERENLREFHMDIKAALHKAKTLAPLSTRKGIEAIELMSKARRFLKTRQDISKIAEAYHIGA